MCGDAKQIADDAWCTVNEQSLKLIYSFFHEKSSNNPGRELKFDSIKRNCVLYQNIGRMPCILKSIHAEICLRLFERTVCAGHFARCAVNSMQRAV